jgi:hypothetical protein
MCLPTRNTVQSKCNSDTTNRFAPLYISKKQYTNELEYISKGQQSRPTLQCDKGSVIPTIVNGVVNAKRVKKHLSLRRMYLHLRLKTVNLVIVLESLGTVISKEQLLSLSNT